MLVLTVIQGPDKGKKFELPDHEPQLIGRSSEALPLTDTTVSRRHAELTPDPSRAAWYIRDLNSQNGTWVNGERIYTRQRLRVGDQIRTGATLFVFGKTEGDDTIDVIRITRPDLMESSIEAALPSNEDSVVLAEPEPRTAAVHHLRVIYQLTTLLSQTLDRNKLLEGVMDLVFSEFKPERGFIVLSEGMKSSRPQPAVVKYATPPTSKDDAKFHISRTILQTAVRSGEGVLSTNAMHDPRFAARDSVQRLAIRSAICSPIRFRDRTFGAIYIDSTIANYTFTQEQLALMNAVGQHTGLALANLELYAEKLRTERLAAIGQTVASLSHSIKNILQGLRGGADVVEMGLKKEDLKVARGGWGILKRNLDRIMGLSMNMLAYSRQRKPEPELVRIADLVEDCAQLLQDQATSRQVALIVDADHDMPPFALDPGLIHQALMNLMGNAVEAVEPGRGIVTVSVTYHPRPTPPRGVIVSPPPPAPPTAVPRTGPEVHIAVIDNGPGIGPDKHARIFEPFFSTKGLRGTGLGLAVTQRVVQEHGGAIALDSAPGKGATFTVVLPADTAVSIDPSATADTRQGDRDPL